MSRTRYARSGKFRIAYELRGTMHRRRPWLVLIQGMGFDRSGWEPVLRKLHRHFRLVLVDNRGFGRSDRPAGLFGVAAMAGDIVAVLDAAGIRRAHVMGASLGGMVAQELAITHAERVDGLVLACTAPGWPFAYPMPPAAVRLILVTATRRMPCLRGPSSTIQNSSIAFSSCRTPSRRRTREPWRPRLPRERCTPGAGGRRASGRARWSCRAAQIPWSTRATEGCSRTGSRTLGS